MPLSIMPPVLNSNQQKKCDVEGFIQAHYAYCRNGGCHYAECHGVALRAFMSKNEDKQSVCFVCFDFLLRTVTKF